MLFCIPSRRCAAIAAVLIAATTVVTGPAHAQPSADDAYALYRQGRIEDATQAANQVLATKPKEFLALYVSARANQDAGLLDAALLHVEQLIKYHPGAPAVWEVATQLYQAKGILDRRDASLRQLIAAQASALDKDVRARSFVIRDRIVASGHVVMTQENFDTGSSNHVKYAFIPTKELARPRNYLMVLADETTTNNWHDAGILPRGKRLFHLDSVYVGPNGREMRAMYLTFADLPDYDTIRARVIDIMAGKLKPMSGKNGGLAVPAEN